MNPKYTKEQVQQMKAAGLTDEAKQKSKKK